MFLDAEIMQQLEQYLTLLENDIVIKVTPETIKYPFDMVRLIDEIANLRQRFTLKKQNSTEHQALALTVRMRIRVFVFAGIPLGHEFKLLSFGSPPGRRKSP